MQAILAMRRSTSTSTCRPRVWGRRGSEISRLRSFLTEVLQMKVERTGIEPVTSGSKRGASRVDVVGSCLKEQSGRLFRSYLEVTDEEGDQPSRAACQPSCT